MLDLCGSSSSKQICIQSPFVTSAATRVQWVNEAQSRASVELDIELNYESRIKIEHIFIEKVSDTKIIYETEETISTYMGASSSNEPPVLRRDQVKLYNGTIVELEYDINDYKQEAKRIRDFRPSAKLEDISFCDQLFIFQADYWVPLGTGNFLQVLYHDAIRCYRQVNRTEDARNNNGLRPVPLFPSNRRQTNIISAAYEKRILFEFTADGLIIISHFKRGQEPNLSNPLGVVYNRRILWLTPMVGGEPTNFFRPELSTGEFFIKDPVCREQLAGENGRYDKMSHYELLRPKPYRTVFGFDKNSLNYRFGLSVSHYDLSNANDPDRMLDLGPNQLPKEDHGLLLLMNSGVFNFNILSLEATVNEHLPVQYNLHVPNPNSVSNHLLFRNKLNYRVAYIQMGPTNGLKAGNMIQLPYSELEFQAIPDDIAYRHGCNQIVLLMGLTYSLIPTDRNIMTEVSSIQILDYPFLNTPIDAMHSTPQGIFEFYTRSRTLIRARDLHAQGCQSLHLEFLDEMPIVHIYKPDIKLYPEGSYIARHSSYLIWVIFAACSAILILVVAVILCVRSNQRSVGSIIIYSSSQRNQRNLLQNPPMEANKDPGFPGLISMPYATKSKTHSPRTKTRSASPSSSKIHTKRRPNSVVMSPRR